MITLDRPVRCAGRCGRIGEQDRGGNEEASDRRTAAIPLRRMFAIHRPAGSPVHSIVSLEPRRETAPSSVRLPSTLERDSDVERRSAAERQQAFRPR